MKWTMDVTINCDAETERDEEFAAAIMEDHIHRLMHIIRTEKDITSLVITLAKTGE